MIEPCLALQTAIRQSLITAPSVIDLVSHDSIRAGSIRPERMPAIILNGHKTEFLGRAAGGQLVARAIVNTSVWGIENGQETAQAIAFAVAQRLFDAPATDGSFSIDEWTRPEFVWLRDPQPERAFTHGMAQCEAVIRWKV